MYNQIRRQEQKEDLIRQVQEAAASGSQHGKEIASRIKLIQGDFQYIDDKSIDLIFTDPPYHKEWLPMYEPLGKLACSVLKEEGSLVMYAGHYALPQIFDYMKNSGLLMSLSVSFVLLLVSLSCFAVDILTLSHYIS